jgi:hypothetical protein
VVADPLEEVGYPDRGHQESQVARHRLLEAQEIEAAALHLELDAIDGHVLGHHVARERRVAAAKGVHRLGKRRLGASRHVAQAILKGVQVVMEMTFHVNGPRLHSR